MANTYTPFSTGKVRVGALGVTLTDADNIPNIQSVQFNNEFQEALVRTAAHINLYPTADAQYDGDVRATFEVTGFPEALIPLVMGISAVTAGGFRTYPGTLTGKPVYHQWEFVGETPDGKEVTINLPRVKTRSFSPNFTREDFQNMSFESHSLPNDTYAPFIFRVEE
jgi:hypothetical protein